MVANQRLPKTTKLLYGVGDVGNAVVNSACLLYTSDAADDLLCVALGGRRIIKKKKHRHMIYEPEHS